MAQTIGSVVSSPSEKTGTLEDIAQVDKVEEEGKKLLDKLGIGELRINTSDEKIISNVYTNIRRGLPQVFPYPPNDQEVCLVGGGWSLEETFDELRDAYWRGAKVVAVNGAARWLMERNIRPSAVVVMDARPSNRRFLEIDPPDCKFFLASQCDSELFEAVEGKNAHIYHVMTTDSDEEKQVLKDYYLDSWHIVPGTCCVSFRAIMLFRMLGFQWFKVFGVDSCYADDGRHHSYEQPENENEPTAQISCGGRIYRCSAWQISQAVHFLELVKHQGNQIKLSVFGDGLIANMIKSGAGFKEE